MQAGQERFHPPLKLGVQFQRAGRCSGAGCQPDRCERIRQVQRCALGWRDLPGAKVPPVRTPLHLPPHPRERQVPPLPTCIGHNTGAMISIAAGREAVAVETWQRTPLKAQSSLKASRESEASRPEKLHWRTRPAERASRRRVRVQSRLIAMEISRSAAAMAAGARSPPASL